MRRAPRLREDVVIRPSAELKDVYYLRDPLLDTYYELNGLQYDILSRLDGTPLSEISKEVSRLYKAEISVSDLEEYLVDVDQLELLDHPGPDIRSEELRREVGKRARRQLRKQGYSLEERGNRTDDRRKGTPERKLFGAALAAVAADEISAALRYLSTILDLNPLNARARIFRRVLQDSLIKIRRQHRARGDQLTEAWLIRLLNPDRLLHAIDRRLGWFIYSWFAAVLGAALVLSGGWIALTKGGEFVGQAAALAIEHPALAGGIAYISTVVSMFLHETIGHGLTCKHYGGSVRSAGLAFISIVPAAYCDLSDAYILPRQHRIAPILAGVINDIVWWAFFLIIWRVTEPGTIANTVAMVFSALSGLDTLQNLVPFIKSDGYYVLVEVLGTPNLYDLAKRRVRSIVVSLLSGNRLVDADVEEVAEHRWILLPYRSAVVAVRVFFYLWLLPYYVGDYLIEHLRAWGLLIFLALWYIMAFRGMRGGGESFYASFRRAISVDPSRFWKLSHLLLVGIPMAVVACVLFLPWEMKLNAPIHLEPNHHVQLRTREAGRVLAVRASEGDQVHRGDIIVELERDELHARWREVEAMLSAVDARIRLVKAGVRNERVALLHRKVERLTTEVQFAARRYTLLRGLESTRGIAAREVERAKGNMAVTEERRSQALAELRKETARAAPEILSALEAEHARYATEATLIAERLQRRKILAPVDGEILTPRLMQIEGSYLRAGEAICEVADRHRMETVALVRARELRDVRHGTLMKIKLLGFSATTRYCRVHRIAEKPQKVAELGERFAVRCLLPPGSPELAVGLTGKAELFAGRRRVLDMLLRPLREILTVDFWVLF
jgi:putative peptide zinc metalloprotease protein